MDEERRKQVVRSWDTNAAVWSAAVRGHSLESRRLVTDFAILEATLACGGSRVLDVGCGEGWLARSLAEAGRVVTAFDGSRGLIDRARRSGGATFLVLDYDAFAAAPHSVGDGFDVAVCNFSILTDDSHALLVALRQVTHSSGRLVIQTVHPDAVPESERAHDGWREERFDGLPGEWAPMPWYFRTLESWLDLLRGAGWEVEGYHEPVHPETGRPVSLILTALRAPEERREQR